MDFLGIISLTSGMQNLSICDNRRTRAHSQTPQATWNLRPSCMVWSFEVLQMNSLRARCVIANSTVAWKV